MGMVVLDGWSATSNVPSLSAIARHARKVQNPVQRLLGTSRRAANGCAGKGSFVRNFCGRRRAFKSQDILATEDGVPVCFLLRETNSRAQLAFLLPGGDPFASVRFPLIPIDAKWRVAHRQQIGNEKCASSKGWHEQWEQVPPGG